MAGKCSNYARGSCFSFWIMLFEADYAKNYAGILYQCLHGTLGKKNIESLQSTALLWHAFTCIFMTRHDFEPGFHHFAAHGRCVPFLLSRPKFSRALDDREHSSALCTYVLWSRKPKPQAVGFYIFVNLRISPAKIFRKNRTYLVSRHKSRLIVLAQSGLIILKWMLHALQCGVRCSTLVKMVINSSARCSGHVLYFSTEEGRCCWKTFLTTEYQENGGRAHYIIESKVQ